MKYCFTHFALFENFSTYLFRDKIEKFLQKQSICIKSWVKEFVFYELNCLQLWFLVPATDHGGYDARLLLAFSSQKCFQHCRQTSQTFLLTCMSYFTDSVINYVRFIFTYHTQRELNAIWGSEFDYVFFLFLPFLFFLETFQKRIKMDNIYYNIYIHTHIYKERHM